MQLPTRLSVALGTLIGGLTALSLELTMSHPLHVVCALVGGFLLYLIHPAEAGLIMAPSPSASSSSAAGEISPVPGASARPTPPPAGSGGQPL